VTQNATQPEVTKVKVRLCHLGNVLLEGHKLGSTYALVRDGEVSLASEDRRHFVASKHGGNVGCIYEFDATSSDAASIYPASYSFVCHARDGEIRMDPSMLLEFEQAHRAARDMKENKTTEKRAKERNLLRETLEPVRVAYRNLPNTQRAAFLARVMQYVLTGPTE
jgi:hypothetical protein